MAEQDSNTGGGAAQPQPGQVVAPGSVAPPPTAPQSSAPSQPDQTLAQAMPQPPVQASAPQPQPETSLFNPDVSAAAADTPSSAGDAISWTASEFVAHEKSSNWYLGLAAAGLAIAGLIYLITRDIISTIVVLVGAFCFGVLGSRKPRQQQYILDATGLSIGRRRFNYSQFRSFTVAPEGAFSSIVFMPLKRFAQTTTIYYAPEDEDKIVDLISQSLPFEEHKADAVDNLMRRIRF